MPDTKNPGSDKLDQLIAEARRNREQREKGYRERAMKLFPPICARCGREFEGKRLRELTVHHKDHNHDNNPPDGSNWELLCLFCHDNEHSRYVNEEHYEEATPAEKTVQKPSTTFRAFAGLDALLKKKSDDGK
ncbi:MAG: YajD family HNH nuclease [Syntrophobacter sp.]